MGWELVALLLVVVGLPLYFDHRQKMAKLRTQNAAPDTQLLARVEALEKKCEMLQQQVNEAHMLIHDETRELDRKLLDKIEAK
jgi:hypothetical protein